MSAVVADASAVVEFLRGSHVAPAVAERITAANSTLHLPHLCAVEVANAFRGLVRAGDLSGAEAETGITELATLKASRHPAEPFLQRIWELRHNLTAYDATYVALAEALGAPLLTVDDKLNTRSVRKLIAVEVIT